MLGIVSSALLGVSQNAPGFIDLGIDPAALFGISKLARPTVSAPIGRLKSAQVCVWGCIQNLVQVGHGTEVDNVGRLVGWRLGVRHLECIQLRENFTDTPEDHRLTEVEQLSLCGDGLLTPSGQLTAG